MLHVSIKPERLTDGSVAYNVEIRQHGACLHVAIIGASDMAHAERLQRELADAAWAEVADYSQS